MTAPTISVLMPSFNHGDYVADAIRSVLRQEGVSFELLIEDDGSTDHSHEVLSEFANHPNVRMQLRQNNLGGAATHNSLLTQACGEYVALINSDDAWVGTDKLRRQLDILESRPDIGACFGRARYIDSAGHPIPKQSINLGTIFDEPNHTQAGWLRRFFLLGNCLCHPTSLIRRACYERVGHYDNTLRQVPDFDMWIRMVKLFGIHVLDNELIEFRLREGENTSSPTATNSLRVHNEYFFVYSNILDEIDDAIFVEGFSDLLERSDLVSHEHLTIQKALLFLRDNQWLTMTKHLIGIQRLRTLMHDPGYTLLLKRDFGITDKWFHEITAKQSPFVPLYVHVQPEVSATPQRTRRSLPFLRYFSPFRR